MPPASIYTVRLTASALRELDAIRSYIKAQGAPIAAETTVARLAEAVEGLAIFPHRRRSAGRDVRELVTVPPYVIRYRIRSTTVQIIRIRHGARKPADIGELPGS